MRKNNITLSLENTISFSRNITSHFTGKKEIITLGFIIIMLSFVNIINTSALSYQSSVGVGFTFNPTLSVNISPSNLTIDNLTPGTTSDSNTINISVAINSAYGYNLSATMNGNDSNLTHSNGVNVFSSIATNSSLSNLTTDNTWGYSYKNNLVSSPTWSSYSGLSNSVDKVLFNTDSSSNGSIDFKIAAKASETQASGTYTGTINFTATTKPMPKTIDDIAYMQTFAELDAVDLASVKSSMVLNSTYTLKDIRDEQEYTVAKLADNKIWMTKNLNLAGGTTISCETSDCDNYTIPENQGWQTGGKLPESSTNGFNTINYAYVYNSNNTTTCSTPGCYSYYSWDAATLGSGRNINTKNTDTPYSICPKGWKLPSTYDGSGVAAGATDFRKLIIALGGSDSIQDYNNNTLPKGSDLYALLGTDTIPNFLRAGYYDSGSFSSGGRIGYYWSSTSNGNGGANRPYFSSATVGVAGSYSTRAGFSVRCLAR